jgi:hypothetical protein
MTTILERLCQKTFALIDAEEFRNIEVDGDPVFISQFYPHHADPDFSSR